MEVERLYVSPALEWKRGSLQNRIANGNDNMADKTFKIQEDHIRLTKCDNGEECNIYLLDKTDIHKLLQVINQYSVGARG